MEEVATEALFTSETLEKPPDMAKPRRLFKFFSPRNRPHLRQTPNYKRTIPANRTSVAVASLTRVARQPRSGKATTSILTPVRVGKQLPHILRCQPFCGGHRLAHFGERYLHTARQCFEGREHEGLVIGDGHGGGGYPSFRLRRCLPWPHALRYLVARFDLSPAKLVGLLQVHPNLRRRPKIARQP